MRNYLRHVFSAILGFAHLLLVFSGSVSANTYMVKDINQKRFGSAPEGHTNVGGTVFFTADDGIHGTELWASTEFGEIVVEIESVSTKENYLLVNASMGAKPYIDRAYTVSSISSGLDGGILVRTANDDKSVSVPEHLLLNIKKESWVYVCYDKRGARTPPTWLQDGTWKVTNESISTTDLSASPLWVFAKTVSSGQTLTLGGNLHGGDTGARSNYFVVVKPIKCRGDFDSDGDVDGSDLSSFSMYFGRTDCAGDCKGDFDEDGDVDVSDLAVFAADFGRTDCP